MRAVKKYMAWRICCLCCVLPFIWSPPVVSEMYQWVDEHGKVQFSDRKPPEIEADKVEVKPLNVADEVEVRKPLVPQETYAPVESLDDKRKQKLKKFCKKMKKEYIKLTWGQSGSTTHTVLTRDGKAISRREQNQLAEQFRKKANNKGCRIQQRAN